MERNSVFLGREAHILRQLHIMVQYVNFYGFLKNQILAQNQYVLSFGFHEKRLLVAKTNQNFIFLGYEIYILDQL
jgi:hypothetical protein